MSARRPIGFSPQEISALINGEVVSRHAEEAAFLWLRRERTAHAPNCKLSHLAALDERVEAHVDGLRAAGEVGWNYARQQLELEGHGEVFTAAVLAFESGSEEKIALVLERGAADPGTQHALASALAWATRATMESRVSRLLEGDSAEHRRIGMEAARLLRLDPGPGLAALLRDADPSLRASAARASGELGRMDLLQELGLILRDGDAACRFAAAWASAMLGIRSPMVLTTLREAALAMPEVSKLAAETLVACIDPGEALAWYGELRKEASRRRLAIQVAGCLGDPVLVEDLIEAMNDVTLSRVAGESFSRLTGVDLSFSDLDGDAPADYDDSAYDDPDDPQVELSYDHDLPWPARSSVETWWENRRADFTAGRRYLLGKPLGPQALHECLEKGKQPQRAAAALLLALHAPGHVMMETTERGLRQLRSS
jgi:uncharacterized protein (TIGR02270 family)